jgi:hypothetical protein
MARELIEADAKKHPFAPPPQFVSDEEVGCTK